MRQFQTSISGVAGTDMKQPLMFLTLFSVSAEDGSRQDVTTVPLIYGPLLIAGFEGIGTIPCNRGTPSRELLQPSMAMLPVGR